MHLVKKRLGSEPRRMFRPWEHVFVTSQGFASGRFQRACDRGQVLQAEMAAREMGRLSLMHALSLVMLYARTGSPKFEPAAVRWLARLALEGREVPTPATAGPTTAPFARGAGFPPVTTPESAERKLAALSGERRRRRAGALSGAAAPRAAVPMRPDPAAFVQRLVVQIVRDDYARAWLTLHPAHKAVAPRWAYVDCELLTPIPGRIDSLRIVRVAEKRLYVAGVGRVTATAVRFRLVLSGVEITHTPHLVEVEGRWRCILTPERYELYRAGGCAGKSPLA